MLEVMMAVGVVALLASLTVFGQFRAREMRERMRCLNSLRQWSIALSMYANEHDGAYPRSPTMYHKSPEVTDFLAQYLHVNDSGAYPEPTLPLAMCKSGAASVANNTSLLGWTLLAGYSNSSAYQYDYAGLDMTTERSAIASGRATLACMTATDGSHWMSHGINFQQSPLAQPRGQVAAWADGHARWVKYENLEPALTESGSTYFMPGKNLE